MPRLDSFDVRVAIGIVENADRGTVNDGNSE